jgi:sec-independent protein translocase protein TatA
MIMGIGGISVPSLLLIFLIVLLLFGTKKLRGLGGDLGTAIRGFKSGLKGDEANNDSEKTDIEEDQVTEGKTQTKDDKEK